MHQTYAGRQPRARDHMGQMVEPAVETSSSVMEATVALGGISFAVARGITAALLGGNGAGKTTTLSIPPPRRAFTDGRVKEENGVSSAR